MKKRGNVAGQQTARGRRNEGTWLGSKPRAAEEARERGWAANRAWPWKRGNVAGQQTVRGRGSERMRLGSKPRVAVEGAVHPRKAGLARPSGDCNTEARIPELRLFISGTPISDFRNSAVFFSATAVSLPPQRLQQAAQKTPPPIAASRVERWAAAAVQGRKGLASD